MMKRVLFVALLSLFGATVSSAQDGFNLSSASIADSAPGDVASWPITVHIDAVTFDPVEGLSFQKSGADWPDYTPPGWGGPIQYTVWACQMPQLVCVGVIQMWRDRPATGAPLPSNWTFWWGPSAGGAIHAPFGNYAAQPGDNMGFFLTAGNARGFTDVSSVRQRSQVVIVRLPFGDSGVFEFPVSPTPPQTPAPVLPSPVVPSPPVVVPSPEPTPPPPVVVPPPPVVVEPAPLPSTPVVTPPAPVVQPPQPTTLKGVLLTIVTGILAAILILAKAGAL
jgi:hypothetical protein